MTILNVLEYIEYWMVREAEEGIRKPEDCEGCIYLEMGKDLEKYCYIFQDFNKGCKTRKMTRTEIIEVNRPTEGE